MSAATRCACVFALVSLAAVPVLAQEKEDSKVLNLARGEQKVVNVSGVKQISVGNPSVADVKVLSGGRVLVTGIGSGSTTIIFFKHNGKQVTYVVTVGGERRSTNEDEIRALLAGIEGITIRGVGSRIVIDGEAFSVLDYERITEVADDYANVQNLVRLNPNAAQLAANKITDILIQNGLRNARAVVVGNTIFLEGSVEADQDIRKAELLTKAIGRKVENLLTVGIDHLIYSEIQFVEVRKASTDKLGLKLPLDIEGNVIPEFSYNRVVIGPGADQANFNLGIQATAPFAFGLQFNDGYTRILAQPKLVAASGEKATFLAGGEIPIPIATQNTFSVEWKEYGIRLSLRGDADRQGNIKMDVEAELSDIDRAVSVQGIPGFRTRRVKTQVNIKNRETIALSGLFQNNEQKDVSKFPGLGNIPILGELFKSRNFQDQKTELVIFVTPRVAGASDEKIQSLVRDAKNRYEAAADEVHFSLLD